MFQKLENVYLDILRAVVIVAAGILLVASIIYGMGMLKGLSGPSIIDDAPEVESRDVLNDVLKGIEAKKTKKEAAQNTNVEVKNDKKDVKNIDPNQKYLERSVNTADEFVKKTAADGDSLSREKFYKILQSIYPESAESREVFAEGLAETFEKVLKDESVINEAKNTSPFIVLNTVIDAYLANFNGQVDEISEKNSQAEAEHRRDKANAAESMYFAGGSFLAFLLIVFLSIFIKIERNLRNLEIIAAKNH
jgi:hypothetical protein